MQQIKWFERKFDFSTQQNIFPAIIERLIGTPLRLRVKVEGLSGELLQFKPEGKWSIKEHIGHIIDLESLWQGRLEDILAKEKYLRPTDLSNRQVDAANYNQIALRDLLKDFEKIRAKTEERVKNVDEKTVFQTALHPRLEQPMRTMDLFLFVAEHDDHHLARISEIIQQGLK